MCVCVCVVSLPFAYCYALLACRLPAGAPRIRRGLHIAAYPRLIQNKLIIMIKKNLELCLFNLEF